MVVAVVLWVVRAQGARGACLDGARAGDDLPWAVIAGRRWRSSRRRRWGVELRVDPVADVLDSRPDPWVRPLGAAGSPGRRAVQHVAVPLPADEGSAAVPLAGIRVAAC